MSVCTETDDGAFNGGRIAKVEITVFGSHLSSDCKTFHGPSMDNEEMEEK